MARGRGRAPKGKYDDLDTEWKVGMASAKEEEINAKLKDLALGRAAILEAREQDPDLKDLKGKLKIAGEQYRDGLKGNALRVAFLRETLAGRGKDGDGDYEKK